MFLNRNISLSARPFQVLLLVSGKVQLYLVWFDFVCFHNLLVNKQPVLTMRIITLKCLYIELEQYVIRSDTYFLRNTLGRSFYMV